MVGGCHLHLLAANVKKAHTGVIAGEHNQFRVGTEADVRDANALRTHFEFLDDNSI